jgi:hypothetical protein
LRRTLEILVVALIGLTSCGGSGHAGITPAQSGPAFEVEEIRDVPCPDSASATSCVEAQITNVGEDAGGGSCRVRVEETTTAGEEGAVFGDPIPLEDVAPGADVTVTLTWSHAKPSTPFGVECQPGLQS